MRESETLRGWEGALERWLAPFLSALGREAQRRWAPVHLKGLILPGERKSVEPLAARVAPDGTEQLHHFIGGSPRPSLPAVRRRVLAVLTRVLLRCPCCRQRFEHHLRP